MYVRKSFYSTADQLSFHYWTFGVFGNEKDKNGQVDNMTVKSPAAQVENFLFKTRKIYICD